jgi:hypothetical protein
MKRPQQKHQQQPPQPQQPQPEPLFKHSPFPDPGQAVESGEPTLTGDETDRAARPQSIPEPDEGAHWESGQPQSG